MYSLFLCVSKSEKHFTSTKIMITMNLWMVVSTLIILLLHLILTNIMLINSIRPNSNHIWMLMDKWFKTQASTTTPTMTLTKPLLFILLLTSKHTLLKVMLMFNHKCNMMSTHKLISMTLMLTHILILTPIPATFLMITTLQIKNNQHKNNNFSNRLNNEKFVYSCIESDIHSFIHCQFLIAFLKE